jgi:hypothetical protein
MHIWSSISILKLIRKTRLYVLHFQIHLILWISRKMKIWTISPWFHAFQKFEPSSSTNVIGQTFYKEFYLVSHYSHKCERNKRNFIQTLGYHHKSCSKHRMQRSKLLLISTILLIKTLFGFLEFLITHIQQTYGNGYSQHKIQPKRGCESVIPWWDFHFPHKRGYHVMLRVTTADTQLEEFLQFYDMCLQKLGYL